VRFAQISVTNLKYEQNNVDATKYLIKYADKVCKLKDTAFAGFKEVLVQPNHHRIGERSRETSVNIAGLGNRSEDIGNIVGTIEDNADQSTFEHRMQRLMIRLIQEETSNAVGDIREGVREADLEAEKSGVSYETFSTRYHQRLCRLTR